MTEYWKCDKVKTIIHDKKSMREHKMADKIKRTPLQSEIIRYIQEYIEENRLEAGERLPSQGQLIQMMGVSRTSLREAMKTLEAREIIKVKNG